MDRRGHHRITIGLAAASTPAIRCYEKAGFRPAGIMRRYERLHEDQDCHDGLLMDLLAEDLLDSPAS
jgi:aminoglycoside 6'-N-acetyltransferase